MVSCNKKLGGNAGWTLGWWKDRWRGYQYIDLPDGNHWRTRSEGVEDAFCGKLFDKDNVTKIGWLCDECIRKNGILW